MPGLFKGAQVGVQAYFDYINSQGGVNGRKIVLKTGDDAYSCSQNQSETQSLVNQVFAFVGSFSVEDGCSASVFTANPNVADVSYSLTPQAFALPNNFSIEPRPAGFRTGPFQWYKSMYNATKVGAIEPSSAQFVWTEESAAMKSVGYTVGYVGYYQPTQTDFTANVIAMKNAGVNFVWLSDTDLQSMARVLQAMYTQGYKPKVIMTAGTGYDANFFKLVQPAWADGMLTDMQYPMFAGEDKAAVPAVATFLQWTKTADPSFPPNLFADFGWASAQLFVQALRSAGSQPTQQSVLAALKGIHSFDADGMVAPADPAGKKPPTCYVIIQANGGAWKRVTPASGYQCSPGGFFYAKS